MILCHNTERIVYRIRKNIEKDVVLEDKIYGTEEGKLYAMTSDKLLHFTRKMKNYFVRYRNFLETRILKNLYAPSKSM